MTILPRRPDLGRLSFQDDVNVTPLLKYADELDALADQAGGHGFRDSRRYEVDLAELRRRLYDMADRMRRDASVTPNAKPIYVGSRPPISGSREVVVVRERKRG
jgi:hypothetical protein